MKILLADDDEAFLAGLAELLARSGWEVACAHSAEEALGRLAGVHVLVSDLRLPGMDGLALLREARQRSRRLEVIVMTGHGTIPTAVEAMRRGARAYLTKPFEPEELHLHLLAAEEILKLREDTGLLGRGQLHGASAAMRRVYGEIDAAAATDAAVLITGETGAGKELAARAVHALSARKRGPFVAVNVGAMPRELVESELFGHQRGAFTGAHAGKRGRFVLADGGTLFLDEINSLPLEIQPKLLRALEAKEVWPLGAEAAVAVDVRILAATNVRGEHLTKTTFRPDLFYRLNVLQINLPPLRERLEDIPLLTRVLLDRLSQATPGRALDIANDALASLMVRNWPGNVRELSNALERAVARATAAAPAAKEVTLELGHLDPETKGTEVLSFKEAKERAADEWSKRTLQAALARSGGNVTEAAKQLRMSRTALQRLIQKYGILGLRE